MTQTASTLARFRRMTARPADDATWTDELLTETIERYPVADEHGRDPEHYAWEATYDLNAAAAEVWEAVANELAELFDFSADGGTFSQRQKYENANDRAAYYRAHRKSRSVKVRSSRPYVLNSEHGINDYDPEDPDSLDFVLH